jgi:hypothetical protein
MHEVRNEDKILPYYFKVAAGLYVAKWRNLRETEEKSIVSSDDGSGN